MKRLAIAFIGIALIALSCSTRPPVAATLQGNSPLTAEYTLQYTIKVQWHGNYYPGETAIHVELADIPVQTDHQQVQATPQDGSIENINGRETWVIDTTDIYTTTTFTGTFVVRVNAGNTPAVPHQPLTQASGMGEYLSPDNYVTLSAGVVSQARQLVSETENDVPKIITKFVDWIQKNITYSPAVGGGTVKLTDTQVLNIRAGVCDEFSTLFMGFCRATGIPARRVMGYGLANPDEYLYTNIENTSHSWTEVWIPNYGWLTVDPTWADIGDAYRIATSMGYGEDTLTWLYNNAPPESGITDVTYSITLANWRVIDTVTPSALTKEETENAWEITVKNSSSIPLLDNVTVEKDVLENLESWKWSGWSVVSNELIFMNPQETYTFSLDKENGVGYFVWTSMAENEITMWQYPGATPTTPTPTSTTITTPTTTTTTSSTTTTTTTTAPPTTTTTTTTPPTTTTTTAPPTTTTTTTTSPPTSTTSTATSTTTTSPPTATTNTSTITPIATTTSQPTSTTTTTTPTTTTTQSEVWTWVAVGIGVLVVIAIMAWALMRRK